ncbi:MAG: hypothetical protein UU02_C0003G0015, partial [Candidatus Woesebacteria bacterium GW2011_GWA1_40_43]
LFVEHLLYMRETHAKALAFSKSETYEMSFLRYS